MLLIQLEKEASAVLEAGAIVRQDDDAQVVILADRGVWDGQVYCSSLVWRATWDIVHRELGCSRPEETISGQEALDTDISTAAKLYAEVCRRHVYDVALHAISLATDQPETYSKVRDSNASRQCDLETARATCPAHFYQDF